jgi:hypothetical protein
MPADPTIRARYLLDRCTPPEIREELEKRLGAREGDSIAVWDDGTVTLARRVSGAVARAVLPTLHRARADESRRSSDHLRLIE